MPWSIRMAGRFFCKCIRPRFQNRDGAGPLLQASRGLFPFIERVFADTAYAAARVANATRIVVEKSPSGQ